MADKFLERMKDSVNHMGKNKMKHHKTKERKHKEHGAEHHTAEHKPEHHGMEHKPEHNFVKKERQAREENSRVSGNTEKVLVDNFVALQKVMAELARNFDSLSSRITKLLDLFEMSAKILAEKDFETGKDLNLEREINKKMEKLSYPFMYSSKNDFLTGFSP